MDKRRRELNAWLLKGYKKGYISDVFCMNHDGYAPEDTELLTELIEEYDNDYCLSVVRVKWDDER